MTAPAPVPDGTTPPAEAVEAVILTAIERRLRAVHYNPHPPAPDDRQCDCSACTDGIPAPDMAWHLTAAVVAALRLPERDRESAAKALDEPGDAARLHLIQYRDPDGFHSTTVACWDHESAILAVLRAEGIGCSATTAPILSRCDGCENDRARASALREGRD